MRHTKLCVSRNDDSVIYACEPGQKPDPDSIAAGECVSIVLQVAEGGQTEITHLMPRETFDRTYRILDGGEAR